MNGRKYKANSSYEGNQSIICVFHVRQKMEAKSDSSESDSESLSPSSKKRQANGKEITRKRKKPAKESPEQLSKSSPQRNIQISPGGSEINFQNSLISASISRSDPQILPEGSRNTFPNSFVSVSNIYHNNPQISQGEKERNNQNQSSAEEEDLSSSPQQGISSYSGSLLASQYKHPFVSEQNLVYKDPGLSATNPSKDLVSFRNLSLLDLSDPRSLQQKQENLFRNLWRKPENEVEDLSDELRIFQPVPASGLLSEDQHILEGIRKILEREGKVKSSTCQMETFSKHQTVDKDVYQNLSYQGNQNYLKWDEFLKNWRDVSISDSSEGLHHEFISNAKETPSSFISKGERKRKNGPKNALEEATKRLCIAENPESASTSDSSSSDTEQGSNQKIDLLSFEMDMMVLPVSSSTSKANTSSRLEKFLKNTKLKLLDPDPIPIQELISHDPSGLASWTEDFTEIQQEENVIYVEENASSGTNNSDKIEELIGEEPAAFVFPGDEKIS